jgi:hypothetical protein
MRQLSVVESGAGAALGMAWSLAAEAFAVAAMFWSSR